MDDVILVCGCGCAPDGAPGAGGCSAYCMSPEPPLTAAEAFAARVDDDLVELTPAPGVVPLCMRCGGGDTCACDPEAAAVWSARLGLPAGPTSARVGVRRG